MYSLSLLHFQIHTRTHTRARAHIHTRAHAHAHAHIHTHTVFLVVFGRQMTLTCWAHCDKCSPSRQMIFSANTSEIAHMHITCLCVCICVCVCVCLPMCVTLRAVLNLPLPWYSTTDGSVSCICFEELQDPDVQQRIKDLYADLFDTEE